MAQHPFTTGRWLEANHLQENENWQIARNKKNEVTSFCYVPNKDIKSIFLGTFPIYEISENNTIGIHPEFFYGSNVNSFWPTLPESSSVQKRQCHLPFPLGFDREILLHGFTVYGSFQPVVRGFLAKRQSITNL